MQSQPDLEYVSDSEGTHTSTRRDDTDNEEKGHQLAKVETKTVRNLRLLVALVLVSCTIIASLLVYFYIRKSEEDEFHKQFEDDALKVLTALGTTIENTFTAVDSLVVSVVSFAEATNQTWPFVVIDDFAVKAKKTRALSEAVVLNMYMVVSDEDRLDWEAFTATSNEWVDEALDVQEADPTYTGPIQRNYTKVSVIHGYGEEDSEFGTNRTGPYAVWWHSYPMVTTYPPYNWDLMSSANARLSSAIFDHQLVTVDNAYLIAEPHDYELLAENEIEADFYADLLEPGENPMEPISDILYPILASANKKANFFYDSPEEIQQEDMVAFMAASIYWRDFIKNILPNGSDGIIATFECPCNPTFTYQINGPEVVFVGTIDGHEPKPQYEDMAQSYNLADLTRLAIEKTTYSGIPSNQDHCPVTVTVYPSTEMEERFTSGDDVLFAVIVAMTFVFTSFIFVLYDFWVERRQKVVMTSANKTNAIVTQLFPSNVRERMYQADRSISNSSSRGQRKPLRNPSYDSEQVGTSLNGPPIADIFPNSTVIFADLVGFTSWSATRGPTEVFQLLETLYGAFDALAQRKGVFKIETIGDCYVAVTGLPNPQKNHASIMARFANECMKEIGRVTADLEETLGPGTTKLQLRVGLHSGPVTAGVLRGQKARFQLFGDTVNTAARMESTGKPMHIQVSQATANALIAAGKSRWLHLRPDVVHAKGKGEMQTYWLALREGSMASIPSVDLDRISRDDSSVLDLDQSFSSLRVESMAAKSEGRNSVTVESMDNESEIKGMEGYVDV